VAEAEKRRTRSSGASEAVLLGGSARSERAGDAPAPGPASPLLPWLKAASLFLAVTAIGVGEAIVFGLPGWLWCAAVALGALIAIDLCGLERTTARGGAAPAPAGGVTRRVLGYTSLRLGDDGRGLAADTAGVRTWCEQTGATLVAMVHDVGEPHDSEAAPALSAALGRLAAREVDALAVPRVQCLPPGILRWFTEPGPALVVIDAELDSATEAGRIAARALAGAGAPQAAGQRWPAGSRAPAPIPRHRHHIRAMGLRAAVGEGSRRTLD
jgi:hypothetical protein